MEWNAWEMEYGYRNTTNDDETDINRIQSW
jgi:hypothetical protein